MLRTRSSLAVALAVAAPALASAAPQVAPSVPQGRRIPTPAPVQVTALDIDLRVEGPAMRVQQRVTLSNPTGRAQEFDLVFPLGNGSVVSGLTLKAGDEVLEGNVHTAEEARRIYQEIVRRTLDPALLEHYGEAMFRARVFPVPAHGTRELVLSYTRVVQPEGDKMRLHLPLTAFRRSSSGLKLTIAGEIVALHPITTLYSPTHELGKGTTEEFGAEPIRYRSTFRVEQEACKGDLDFLAYMKARPGNGLLDVTVISERPDPKEDGYFLAVVNGVPDDSIEPDPKNVVFVLDHSGSMQGKKMEQAKSALRFMIERLRPEDRFNLVTYSVNADVFAREMQNPTPAILGAVRNYLDGVQAEGGTNIQAAMTKAVGQFTDTERLNQVVFLTDGLPTVGERDDHKLCKLVKEANAQGARVIAFGVGFDVNGAFLDRLAVQNKGLSEYVLPSENIEDKVPGFYARMQAPLVFDTRLEIAGVRTYDMFPAELGDVYGGHQILLTGRYAGSGEGTLTITGRRGSESVMLRYPARFAADHFDGTRDLVARLWASKKVGFLVDEIRLNGQHQELVDEIVRLGTRFGILTEYTAFLAKEDVDLFAFDMNRGRAREELGRRAGIVTGGGGVSQAANSKLRQRAATVEAENRWLGDDGRMQVIGGVQTVNGRTFFKKGDNWQDSGLAKTEVDREVVFFSEEFFTLLDTHPWLNRCVARTGDVTVQLGELSVRMKRGG